MSLHFDYLPFLQEIPVRHFHNFLLLPVDQCKWRKRETSYKIWENQTYLIAIIKLLIYYFNVWDRFYLVMHSWTRSWTTTDSKFINRYWIPCNTPLLVHLLKVYNSYPLDMFQMSLTQELLRVSLAGDIMNSHMKFISGCIVKQIYVNVWILHIKFNKQQLTTLSTKQIPINKQHN